MALQLVLYFIRVRVRPPASLSCAYSSPMAARDRMTLYVRCLLAGGVGGMCCVVCVLLLLLGVLIVAAATSPGRSRG